MAISIEAPKSEGCSRRQRSALPSACQVLRRWEARLGEPLGAAAVAAALGDAHDPGYQALSLVAPYDRLGGTGGVLLAEL